MSTCKYCYDEHGKAHGNRGKKPTQKQLAALTEGRNEEPDNIDLSLDYDVYEIKGRLPDYDVLLQRIEDLVTKLWDNDLDKSASYGNDTGIFTRDDIDSNDDILKMDSEDVDYDRSNSDRLTIPDFESKVALTDIFTQFNTIEFFNSKDSRTNFIYLVNSSIQKAIDTMITIQPSLMDNLDIMFKGGTTLRIIVKEILRNFTHSVETYLNELSKRSIKLSDYDFEVVSNKDIPSELLTKINVILYVIVLELRNYLHKNSVFYFDFFKLNKSIQQQKLTEVSHKVNTLFQGISDTEYFYNSKLDFIEFGNNCTDFKDKVFNLNITKQTYLKYKYIFDSETENTSECRTDFTIISDLTGADTDVGVISSKLLLKKYYNLPSTIVNLALGERKSGYRLYATHNPDIMFHNESKIVNFSLNRIKFSYTLYITSATGIKYKLDIPGEVLDISHALKNDRRKTAYNGPISGLEFLKEFKFVNNDLVYTSYNLFGHYKDIASILFQETDHNPWLAPKYEKRINRILLIAYIAYFANRRGFRNKVKALEEIVNSFKSNTKVTTIGDPILRDLYNSIFLSINTSPESSVFLTTVINSSEYILKAFKAQRYQTFDQTFNIDHNTTSAMSLSLDYKELY
jgi:hypothetical protein